MFSCDSCNSNFIQETSVFASKLEECREFRSVSAANFMISRLLNLSRAATFLMYRPPPHDLLDWKTCKLSLTSKL